MRRGLNLQRIGSAVAQSAWAAQLLLHVGQASAAAENVELKDEGSTTLHWSDTVVMVFAVHPAMKSRRGTPGRCRHALPGLLVPLYFSHLLPRVGLTSQRTAFA